MHWRISHPEHLLGAMRIALEQGGRFLVGRIAPNGPICRERNVNYIHKAVWGMYAAGVEHGRIARVLDWVQNEALRDNGDFYFPEESPEYKDLQRVYRPLTFGKVAAWIDHPVIRQPRVIDRILQYQHASGGVFNYIGDDPQKIEQQAVLGTLNTTFFGQLMLALDMREPALAAGEWLRQWVDANRQHLTEGLMYTQMNLDGRLLTDIQPGTRISHVVDVHFPKQEFWQGGTTMAYLVDLYEVMRTRWNEAEDKARPYLDAALAILDFEAMMPLDTYLWPSKCKAGWGAGELLRVLVQYDLGDEVTREKAYRVAERVAIFTFIGNQLPDGGWPCLHYPLSDNIPELELSYKHLKGTVWVPPHEIDKDGKIFLPREEMTGENLGELKPIERAVTALLNRPLSSGNPAFPK